MLCCNSSWRSAPTRASKCVTGHAAPWRRANRKLPTIPLYIVDTPTSDDKTATAERIAHQIVTNDQRSAPTDAQPRRVVRRASVWLRHGLGLSLAALRGHRVGVPPKCQY